MSLHFFQSLRRSVIRSTKLGLWLATGVIACGHIEARGQDGRLPPPSAEFVPGVPSPAPSDVSPTAMRRRVQGAEELHRDLVETAKQAASQPVVALDQVSPGWWTEMTRWPVRNSATREGLSLESTLTRALTYSHQIRVFSDLPKIRETAIVEADSAFDWNQFVDTRWNDTSDPVGNTLTAGPGINRFLDQQWTGRAGVRKRVTTGGQLEAAQNIGHQDNNSIYFVPVPQGTARLTLGFTQPLLRGNGKVYNTSLTYLASIDKTIADDEFRRQLQSHLLEVSRAYWAVYFERGILYQKLRSHRRAEEIVSYLRLRQALDASQSQIKSADAALAERRADLSRAFAAVRNAEARLRALVNDPGLGDAESVELIPVDRPTFDIFPVDLPSELALAVHARPEISQALRQIKAAGIRKNMSQNELLPALNLVTEAYVAGLAGSGDIGNAWGDQFTTGRPSYSAGLQFEVPLGNRAARIRDERRALELRQLQNQYAVALETVRLEVEVAVREVTTSQQELGAKQQAVQAREEQLNNLTLRWERLPPAETTASLMLENILSAQGLLAAAEHEYLRSQVTYSLSLTNLRRATGTLMQLDDRPH